MRILLLLAFLLIFSLGTRSQEPNFQFTHKGNVLHVKFSPDGSKLVSYSSGNQDMGLWDVAAGRLIWKRPISFIQKADEYYTLNSIAWSPDQSAIATGSGNGTIQLWDARTGNLRWIADVADAGVSDVTFSGDGKWVVAIPFSDETVAARMFGASSGSLVRTFEGDKCTRIAVGFDKGDSELRIGSLNGGVSVWDVGAGKTAKETGACNSAHAYGGERSYSEDLKLSIRRTTADMVQIEESSGKVMSEMDLNSSKLEARINSRIRMAVKYEYRGYRLIDLASGSERLLDHCGTPFDLSSDGQLFAQSCDGHKTAIRVANLDDGTVSILDGHPSTINAIAYSPDFSSFAIAGNDGNAYLFESGERKQIKSLSGHTGRLMAAAFMPDGKNLVTGDENGELHLWDISTGKLIKSVDLDERSDDVDNIRVSKDGRHVLVTMNGSALLLSSDLTLGSDLRTPESYETTSGNMTYGYEAVPISSAVFSADSAKVFTGHWDGTIRVWDPATGRQLRKFTVGERISFLSEGRGKSDEVIALVRGKDTSKFQVIDLRNGRTIKRSRAVDLSFAEKMAASPDGRFAVVTDISGDATICDIGTMRIREIKGTRDSGSDAVAFSHDSATFLIGGKGQNVELYDTKTLKKLWQLLPDFRPSDVELRMNAERAARVKELTEIKKKRDAEAVAYVRANRDKVRVTFEHYGNMSNPGEKRLMEPSDRNESKSVIDKGASNAVWLRLRNNASLPVKVSTQSMYMPGKDCFHTFSNGEKLHGLCDDREIGIWFSVRDEGGKNVPYGFDFGSQITLLPNHSVVFPVPKELWEKNYTIYFDFSFQNLRASRNDRDMDYGEEIEISVSKSRLAKR